MTLVLCLLLSGCDNSSHAQFADYHQRLATVLDVESIPYSDPELPRLPAKRDLALPVDDIRIGLLDAYELRQCGLFQRIAERNSSLGKVQDKTRSLRYEILLLSGLMHCINTLPNESDVKNELVPILATKQAQLPRTIWNMLFTGKEWRQQLTLYPQTFPHQEFGGFHANIAAIEDLVTISDLASTQKIIDDQLADQLLSHQQNIYRSRYFGQLFYSIANATQWLNITTQLLSQHEDKILCGKNRNQQTAEYLRNVFYRLYSPILQPYMAELDSQYQQIQPPLNRLISNLPYGDAQGAEALRSYKHHYIDGDLHRAFRDAILEHTLFWQRTFKRCQFKVGI
ncbi:hypothetical protein A3K86_04205 [Photobacterium jeanii]|uniref:DUF3080 domain-containing protein n=1 Tax=Photobacterium jeanii TaxID=858640 RepID=A0A178KQF9_9GAMM|nr:hypothetical protein A3K86_04205 [Photobacterium jeanii]